MKRRHVHVAVDGLGPPVALYPALFGAGPVALKPDCAKWPVGDPRVNFAISKMADNAFGIDRLGVQAETGEELAEMQDRLARASIASQAEAGANCRHARSDKH